VVCKLGVFYRTNMECHLTLQLTDSFKVRFLIWGTTIPHKNAVVAEVGFVCMSTSIKELGILVYCLSVYLFICSHTLSGLPCIQWTGTQTGNLVERSCPYNCPQDTGKRLVVHWYISGLLETLLLFWSCITAQSSTLVSTFFSCSKFKGFKGCNTTKGRMWMVQGGVHVVCVPLWTILLLLNIWTCSVCWNIVAKVSISIGFQLRKKHAFLK
jgi:hypothetical protein